MMTEEWIDGYLKGFQSGAQENMCEDSGVLLGVKQLYEALGEERCFSMIRDFVNRFVREDGMLESAYADSFHAGTVNGAKLLFFLYDRTGDEKYRKAIEAVMELLREKPDILSPGTVSMEGLYMVQPFYMEYETRYEKKERYGDIIKQFEKAEILLDNGRGEIGQICLYLVSLIDALSGMSFEIYEKYRKLQDMFKRSFAELYKSLDKENGMCSTEGAGNAENAMIAYAMIKACRMDVILKEKYASDSLKIVENLVNNGQEGLFGDARTVAAFLSAYGQYLLLKKELTA